SRSAVRNRCWEHYARRVSSDDWCCKRNAQCLDAAVRGAGAVGERTAERGKGTCGHLRNGRELHAAERRTGSAAADGEHRTAVPGARADDNAEHSAVRDPVRNELPAADADDGDWAESSLERARAARVASTGLDLRRRRACETLRGRSRGGWRGRRCVRWERCGDRKSTRLNSSHVKISYAVFCLKKKT